VGCRGRCRVRRHPGFEPRRGGDREGHGRAA
jgi:hypothetical protein